MTITKGTLLLQASAGALLWAGSASAQVTTAEPAPAAAQEAAPAAAPAETPAAQGDIVVTGSRVIRNGDASPTPVTVVSPQQALKVQPGTLADSLQILPVFAGSRGSGSNPSSTGSVGAGNGSANQLNLRNLGAEKTLVLMDGKRVTPTLISGIVDVDSIPQMMVSRVDVVTGGASAVYGSDAIAGVVNYVIDRRFNGLKVEAEGGVSELNDGAKYRAGIAFGTDLFDGRGHFEVSYERQKEQGIDRRSDRSWMRQAGVTGAGTAANPYVNQVDIRQATQPAGGLITNGPLSGQTFNPDGTLRAFVAGATTGTNGLQIGGDGGYYDSTLMAPLTFNQFFGRFDYDFTDNIHGYAQVGGNFKKNTAYGDFILLQNVTISTSNAFLSPAVRARFPATTTTFTLGELMMNAPRLGAETKSEQINAVAGLSGDVGKFNWNVDYVHGRSVLKNTQLNNLDRQRLAAALDAVTNPAGQIVCRASITAAIAANYADCVPLNVFGAGNANPTALAYVQVDTHYRATTTLDDASAAISGSPFDTWAGPLTVALSGEWRKMTFKSLSDAGPTDFANCTGLTTTGNCSATVPLIRYQNTFASAPTLRNTVWEVAGEVDVPLLADVSFFKSLNVNGAVRYTSYKTSGSYVTWKGGFDWHVTDSLRFRGTRSRDIRAPTLSDLFAPTYVSVINPVDLLLTVPQSPRLGAENRSNPNLKAEIGNTLTLGAVWKPLPRLSIAVDYYHIEVANAITVVNGSDPAIQNACYDSGGSSPYCLLQSRPLGFARTPANMAAGNLVTGWVSQSINLASIVTKGVDVEANYTSRLFDRPFALRFLAAYQPHLYIEQPGILTRDQAGAAFGPLGAAPTPTVRLTGIVHVEPLDRLSVDILQRWRNPMKLSGIPNEVWTNNHLPSFATTNVTLTYKLLTKFASEVYINVQNLFDATPPTGGFTGNGTRAGFRDGYPVGDNPLGRYFTAGMRMKF